MHVLFILLYPGPGEHGITYSTAMINLISPEGLIYASENGVSTGSGNGLSPIRRQAII